MSKELAKKLIPVKEDKQIPLHKGTDEMYNMVRATLYYNSEESWNRPRGYYMSIHMESHQKGYVTMTIGSRLPSCYALIKRVNRSSKKADAEAVVLFNALVAGKVAEMYGADTCYMEYAA